LPLTLCTLLACSRTPRANCYVARFLYPARRTLQSIGNAQALRLRGCTLATVRESLFFSRPRRLKCYPHAVLLINCQTTSHAQRRKVERLPATGPAPRCTAWWPFLPSRQAQLMGTGFTLFLPCQAPIAYKSTLLGSIAAYGVYIGCMGGVAAWAAQTPAPCPAQLVRPSSARTE
jgi:hypothetical protein